MEPEVEVRRKLLIAARHPYTVVRRFVDSWVKIYTGRSFTPAGDRREVVCEATSTDLEQWTKREDNPILRPDAATDQLDSFRDPYVYRDPVTGDFVMLVTTAQRDGLPRRSGALARARSSDLITWRRDGYFWAPGATFDLECADLFRIGAWWYLIFSTAERTHYRMSRDPDGPWLIPADDLFDDHWFYAAKTAIVGGDRVLFGWLADAEPPRDDGSRVWGGSLISRRLSQADDGSLRIAVAPASPGTEPAGGHRTMLDATNAFRTAPLAPANDVAMELPITVPTHGRFGMMLRTDPALSVGYRLSLDVGAQSMSWSVITPRGEVLVAQRPCRLDPGEQTVMQVTVADSVVDIIVAGSALCARAFDSRYQGSLVWAENTDLSFGEPRNLDR